MLNKLSIRSKLALVVAAPLLALAAVALIGWQLISSSTIGSDRFNEIDEANRLVANVLPPPGFLIEPHLALEEAVLEDNPETRAALVAEIMEARTTFDQNYVLWAEELADEPELLAKYKVAYDAGVAWFAIIESQVVPLLNAGELVAAQEVDDILTNPAFETHRAAIVEVVADAEVRLKTLEKEGVDSTRRNSLLAAVALLALSLIAALIAIKIARAISGPVRQLTAAARTAEANLPAMLASINAAEELPVPEEIQVGSDDELGELAVALNSMQLAAVNLAADQARTRRNVSTMLANLARRNQGLLNRTLSFITRLEENERDPETLDNLFKLDHLTTRMRRNAESLLVLAGSEAPRTWAQPIEVSNVIRAAMSEIEAFDRVEVASMDPVMVRGNAVSDVAHLLAELLDNATRFSPPSTSVSIVGKDTESGYLISIIDQGMGMTAEQLASANREIETVGRFEEGTTMVLGLAVVARLAARNNVLVRLSESPFEGVTAQVRLPIEMIERRDAPKSQLPSSNSMPEMVEMPTYEVQSHSSNGVAATSTSAHAEVTGASAHLNSTSTVTAEPSVRQSAHQATTPQPSYDDQGSSAELPPPSFTPPNSTRAVDLGLEEPASPPGRVASPLPAATVAAPANGLARRVPGTNLFESTLPVAGPTPDIDRSAEDIRDALSSFQHGFQSAPKSGTEAEADS